MIAYSSYMEGATHLFEERISSALISAHCLQNLDEHEYYEIKDRNSKHTLWLWTLHLMRQMASMLIQNSEFTYPLISFITAFEDRIMRVLQFKGYIDGKKQFKSFSIARLEEIEHIINLISFTFINYDQWKNTNYDQVERIINILFSFTVGLFESNVALSDCFHPISEFEKYINKLSGDISPSPQYIDGPLADEEKKSSNINKKGSGGYSNISQKDKSAMVNKIVTSLRTPMKGETSASTFSMLEQDEYMRRPYKTSYLGDFMVQEYNPSGFILKIEISLSKIALMLFRSMHYILKHEIRSGPNSNFIRELSYYHERNNETKLFVVCTNIFDCIQFSLHCQRKWTEDFRIVNNLNKFLNGASLGNDTLVDSAIDMLDVLQISNATSELGLLLAMTLLKAGQLSREETYDRRFLEIADERLIEKVRVFAEECKELTLVKEKVMEEESRKSNKRLPSQLPVGKEKDKLKTNADVILNKLEKDYNNN